MRTSGVHPAKAPWQSCGSAAALSADADSRPRLAFRDQRYESDPARRKAEDDSNNEIGINNICSRPIRFITASAVL